MPTIEELQAELDAQKAEAKKLKDQNVSLKKNNDELKSKTKTPEKKDPPKDDDDLLAKVKKEQEEKEAAAKGDKGLESALSFNLTVADFIKNNKDILPSDFEGVLNLANKESYDSPKQKANAIRSGLIQSFFNVQAHQDLLTDNQKKALADFMKLTKTGKEENSHTVYENVFESAFQMLKQVKKAEDKARVKASEGTNSSSYKDKLVKGSREKYFGKKA